MPGRKGARNRQPLTPKGIELMEKGEMVPYHPEIYSNFNTVALEKYMEERNRSLPREGPSFSWVKLLLMIVLVGIPFAFITQYVALKVGFLISTLFYVAYLIGLALRWKPKEVNILSGAVNLVDQTMVAFAFVYPVMFLLALNDSYILGTDASGNDIRVVSEQLISGPWLPLVVILVSTSASLLALFHFVIFRKLWVVEEPLPTPGFESIVKLMDLANSVQSGSSKAARSSMAKVGIASGLTFVFAFFRDFPISKGLSTLQVTFKGMGLQRWYISTNSLNVPSDLLKITKLNLSLNAISFSIGWYLRTRVAMVLFAGSAFMWLFLVPLAQYMHMPYYAPVQDAFFDVNHVHLLSPYFSGIGGDPSRNAFLICMNVGIGAVLGAGTVSFIKVLPSIREMFRGGKHTFLGAVRPEGTIKNAYEWPVHKIPYVSIMAAIVIITTLILVGGFDPIRSLIVTIFLVLLAFILQAISVKTAGETGSGPTVMIVCISFIILFFLLGPFTGPEEKGSTALLVIIGTTALLASEVVSKTVQWDYKTGLYIGTRPMELLKAQITAVAIGVPICAIAASVFALEMVKEGVPFEAPWPDIYATLVMALSGGRVYILLVLLGVFIGALMELLTGKGIVFGMGMFFSIGTPLMILIGGAARDIWQKNLARKCGSGAEGEEKRTLKLLDSYMVMTGIFLGEALVGFLLLMFYLTH
ncbi:MAG: OPT/YSL family transporter [Candidatus Thermoplasmatota archaeon]|nr:OPT/YSL family transporter [Candidatus Thermoplasmatota archaeon]